jgi:tight adherence protein C
MLGRVAARLVLLALPVLVATAFGLFSPTGPVFAAQQSPGRAVIPPSAPTPPAGTTGTTVPHATVEDDELVIGQVQLDKFPKVTARFTMRPLNGRPVPYMEPTDIVIVANGVGQQVLEAHTVGRVPTSGVGTYEVTWISETPGEAGGTVNGKFSISINGRPEIESGFSFTRPFPRQAAASAPGEAPVVNALIPVPQPNPGSVDQPLASSLAAIMAGTALLVTVGGLLGHAHWKRGQDRLAMWVGRSAEHRARAVARASQSRRSLTLSPTVQFFGQIGAKFVPSAQVARLRRSLVLAGRPTNQEYTRFVATKAGLGLGMAMAGFWLMLPLAPFMTAVMVSGTLGVVGFMVPSFWLARAIKARQYKIRKAMPDALDLITIGVSAGLAFDGACGEIVEKWDNDLSHEFATMLGELRMGAGRRQALLNLTDRTQVDEIQIMASQLIQADELGMSLTDTLLTLANQMRQRRRQRAEELAHKAAVKMLIPLVFLIFPALFIVILGPAAQDMIGFITNGP